MWLFVRIRPFLALVSFVESAIIEITKKPPPPKKKSTTIFHPDHVVMGTQPRSRCQVIEKKTKQNKT